MFLRRKRIAWISPPGDPFSRRRVQDARLVVVRCRYYQLPIGAERCTSHRRIGLISKLCNLWARCRIPDPRGAIARRGHDPLPIWAEGRAVDTTDVAFQDRDLFARDRIPDARGCVRGCGYNSLSIPAERSVDHAGVARKLGDLFSRRDSPDLRFPRRDNNLLSITAERRLAHSTVIRGGDALSRDHIPYTHRRDYSAEIVRVTVSFRRCGKDKLPIRAE